MIAKTGLLIVTNPMHIGKILPTIQNKVKQTLYIHLTSALHEPLGRFRPDFYTSAPKYSQTIRGIYSEAAALCKNLDVRVLLSSLKYSSVKSLTTSRPVEVVIFDKLHEKNDIEQFLKSCVVNKRAECSVITLENNEPMENTELLESDSCKTYKHVVLGGTFDRLHTGHKILLTEAILRSNEKITIGVTDGDMLQGKTLWEIIEPCENRINGVKDFLNDVCTELSYDVVPIEDPYGPTKSDENMEMIVVSAETLRGGVKVNEIREQNGLKPLDIHSVELVDCPDSQEDEEDKISSSTNRMRLLGTLLKKVDKKCDPNGPYVIGLTGGIASGKSAISGRLSKLGAAIIDCDKVAHELYRPGQPCHKLIQEAFGDSVIDEKGEVNRKALGAIVFHDKSEMQRLNELVWPAIAEAVNKQISHLYNAGHKIVIVEAAVLLQAGWNDLCNEVWACVIPPDEAVRRLIERNALSEDDARARLSVQPQNTVHVSKAHVVLCTLWSYDYTQQTVERAWHLLAKRLSIV